MKKHPKAGSTNCYRKKREDKTVKEIYLVRHAEAEHLVQDNKITGGWTDTKLTVRGIDQAEKTGLRLAGELIGKNVKFYSSDLKRARNTAEIILNHVDADIHFTEALREFNNWCAANVSVDQVVELPRTEPLIDWVPYERAESYRMFYDRVVQFMEGIDDNECIVIVSHAGTISKILNWWFEIHSEKLITFDYTTFPCSITKLLLTESNQKNLVMFNDTSHLPLDNQIGNAKFTFKI
jgi:broad specificity phosphatase PhoE